MWWNDIKEIKEWMRHTTDRLSVIDEYVRDTSEDEEGSLESIHGKLNFLMNDNKRDAQVALAEKTLDKFEDYMKNVDKLNAMINEFKGCVSMARSSIQDRKELNGEFDKMDTYCNKISEIHAAIIKMQAKKPPKKKKPIKKKAVPAAESE